MNRRGKTGRLSGSIAAWALLAAGSIAAGAEVTIDGRTFTIPAGFTIERVAGAPLVDRPIVGAFDEQGRLYVADSSGSNENVKIQVETRPHRIVRLEDTDKDGRFDRQTVFADRMMFPEGTMWLDGSLYVSAPPSIWKLTDKDGDGVAEERTEWFQGKTLTGCANDLHGPYPGLDGWIYWCKGAFATQTYERPGRSPLVTRAAHIFRARPDGSGIEPVMTGGMDNPVDVVFSPEGERFFTSTFVQNPEGGRRDGMIHAIYGGVYGKIHSVIDDHPRTSPEVMPVLVHYGPAATSGLTRYESDTFGADYRNNLFATLFNLRKVTRHVLAPNGSTFSTRDEDFVVTEDRDFHPTDVIEDADGSLLVVDTGGWYKLCCPTSQLSKPDVLGAIYRVRRQGAPRVEDPRGLALAWDTLKAPELADLLEDPRPAVRRRAIEALGKSGAAAITSLGETLRASRSTEARQNAVWAATRIDSSDARGLVRSALDDSDEGVRHAAIHSSSVIRDRGAATKLLALLAKDPSPQIRRASAEALGRVGGSAAVPALLQALAKPSDRILEHSLTYALIEIADPRATEKGLDAESPLTRRGALIALDQMEGGGLRPEAVVRNLESKDAGLKETASWILGRHPDWGGALVGMLGQRLSKPSLDKAESADLVRQLARFATAAPIQDLLAGRLRDASSPSAQRTLALEAMARSGLKPVPASWIQGLAGVIAAKDATLTPVAVSTARTLAIPKDGGKAIGDALLGLAGKPDTPDPVRLEALAAVPGGLSEVDAKVFAFLREQLEPEQSVAARGLAADVLSKATLKPEQVDALVDSIKTIGPLELDRILSCFERSTSDDLGLRLIEALKGSRVRSTLRAEMLRPRFAKFGDAVRRESEAFYFTLNVDAAKQKARLESLVSSLQGGDIRRGQSVFNSAKAACVSCHSIGYIGGKVGPDLTRIGQIRTDRDLLEAIVYPSASFVRSYEPLVVATKEGKVINGVTRKDAPDEIVLATGPTEEARIARDDIEEIRPGTVSVMPAGLDQQLSPEELADLVAFLKACR